ncbi:MAG TPA: TonB-dependent receptor [Ohtaekwangia sp.]|nr:TonB-dependent receptor [Ohtaekwangia sp.]
MQNNLTILLAGNLTKTGKHVFRRLIWKVMKVSLIQLFFAITLAGVSLANPTTAQEVLERKVSLSLRGVTLKKALSELENVTKVKFVYSRSHLKLDEKVTLDADRETLGAVLNELLVPRQINFSVQEKNDYIVLTHGGGEDGGTTGEPEATTAIPDDAVRVTGKVTDSQGVPLPGVNILVKGLTSGTTTDSDGNFSLEVPDGDVTLVFSFIGYATQEVALNGQTTLNVSLADDIQSLGEVVVVGYGTQEKREVTSAIAQVSGRELLKSPAISVSNALAGRVPGLIVSQGNAEPGRDDANIYVRGVGTTGNRAALIVVDGVANRDNISRIDPNDIESVTVLKDASAAIYGAQAANGVILITTKRGKAGKPTINYSFNQGFVSPTRELKLADAALFARSSNVWSQQQGQPDIFSPEQIADYESGAEPSTNWIDEVYKSYSRQNRHNISLNGGSEAVGYFVSAGTAYQNGLITGDDKTGYRQYNIRSNIDANITKRLKVGLSLAGRHEDRNWLQYDDNTIYSNTVRALPTIPATVQGYPAEGRQGFNPLAIAKGPGYLNLKRNVFNGTLSGEYQIPGVEGLSIDGFAAVDIVQDFQKHFSQQYTFYREDTNGELEAVLGGPSPVNTFLRQDYFGSQSVTLNSKIKYERTFDEHAVSAFVGVEKNEFRTDNFYARSGNYKSSQIDQLFAGDPNNDVIDGRALESARLSYFGRVNYTYSGKYMVQFHFRNDGSANFPSDTRFGFFPGVSAGWIASRESFLAGNNIISYLKLRASWGKVGNDQFPASTGAFNYYFQYLDKFRYPSSPSRSGYVFDGVDVSVLNTDVAANPRITWETKTTLDFGIDGGLFDDKIIFEFDVFFENRKNVLGPRNSTVPNYTGIILPLENLLEIQNRGVDGQVTYKNTIGQIAFSIGANLTVAKNKVLFADETNLYPTKELHDRLSQEGHTVGARLLYDYIGVYRTQEDLDTYPTFASTTAQLGDPIFRDLNGDNVIDSQNDRMRVNNTGNQAGVPQVQYGIPISVQFKSFDFSALFQGQARSRKLLRYTFNSGTNGFAYFLENAWSESNPDAELPAYNRGNTEAQLSTLWLRDNAFVRLKNIEIGYTLPKNLVSRVGIQNLRFYVSGYNILTFDKMKKHGLPDPESLDIEGWQFPHTKSVNFGLNLTL